MAAPSAVVQNEVLVLTTVTTLDTNAASRQFVQIDNLGPNTIWLVMSTSGAPGSITAGKAIPVWSRDQILLPAGTGIRIYGIAETANQVTGAASLVTELS